MFVCRKPSHFQSNQSQSPDLRQFLLFEEITIFSSVEQLSQFMERYIIIKSGILLLKSHFAIDCFELSIGNLTSFVSLNFFSSINGSIF